jgi:hypothetical protein
MPIVALAGYATASTATAPGNHGNRSQVALFLAVERLCSLRAVMASAPAFSRATTDASSIAIDFGQRRDYKERR